MLLLYFVRSPFTYGFKVTGVYHVFLSRYSVIALLLSYSSKCSAIIRYLLNRRGGGGLKNLVGDELSLWFIIFLLHGLVIFGNSFCGSTTFRMSTRRLPVLLFVSRIEYPFISCCFVARSACSGRRGLLPYMPTMACQ